MQSERLAIWLAELRRISSSPELLAAAFLSQVPESRQTDSDVVEEAAYAQFKLSTNIASGTSHCFAAHREVIENADTTGREYHDWNRGDISDERLAAAVKVLPYQDNPIYLGMAWFGVFAARQARASGISDGFFRAYRVLSSYAGLATAVASVDIDRWRDGRGSVRLTARIRFSAVAGVPCADHPENHPVITPYVLSVGPGFAAADPAGWVQVPFPGSER